MSNTFWKEYFHLIQSADWDVPHGHSLQARCKELGLYKLLGETRVLCSNGLWAPRMPSCVPTTLLTNFSGDYQRIRWIITKYRRTSCVLISHNRSNTVAINFIPNVQRIITTRNNTIQSTKDVVVVTLWLEHWKYSQHLSLIWLNRVFSIDDSPPSIKIKISIGSGTLEPSGVLAVLPGSTVFLDCMYPRRRGNPEWSWTGWRRAYKSGAWSFLFTRNKLI